MYWIFCKRSSIFWSTNRMLWHVESTERLIRRPAGLGHAAPVLERVGDQSVGRDRGDRLVPVLDLDRGERDLDHVAVGAVLGHLDPVADPNHVVAGELDAGHEAEDRVLEDQQQHRGHRAQAAEERPGRSVGQRRDDQDDHENPEEDRDHLDVAPDRPLPGRFEGGLVDLDKRRNQRARGEGSRQVHVGQSRPQQEGPQPLLLGKDDRRGVVEDQRRHQVDQALEDPMFDQDVVPLDAGLAGDRANGSQDQAPGDLVGHDRQQGGTRYQREPADPGSRGAQSPVSEGLGQKLQEGDGGILVHRPSACRIRVRSSSAKIASGVLR